MTKSVMTVLWQTSSHRWNDTKQHSGTRLRHLCVQYTMLPTNRSRDIMHALTKSGTVRPNQTIMLKYNIPELLNQSTSNFYKMLK